MQYVLTEAEYRALQTARRQLENKGRGELQALCTRIATKMPVVKDCIPLADPKRHSPWGCVLVPETDQGYCDHCPVISICPNTDKRISK